MIYKTYNATQAAKYLNVSIKTLQKWDREGKFKPISRTKTNRRVYTEVQLNEFLGLPNDA
jgi:putative resolvase